MKKISLCIVALSIVAVVSGCSNAASKSNLGSTAALAPVSSDNKALKFFKEKMPGCKVITCAEEDITGDGKKDLVVIYEGTDTNNNMTAVVSTTDSFIITSSLPAPVKNQKIEFKDIDQKPPMEFMVSGSKGSNFGYAIYKVEDGSLKDIFGSGMEKCCR